MGPAELEAHNPNYVGGDINGGAADLRQLFARPVARRSPVHDPAPGRLPLLVVDAAGRRRPRHVRLPRGAGRAPAPRARAVTSRSWRLALVLGLLMLVLMAASAPLYLVARPAAGNGPGIEVLMAPFALVGLLIARHQPRNPIGWIFLVLSCLFMLSADAGMYAVYAYRLGHPQVLFARTAVAATQTWIALILLLPLPIVLFPDGHLPSPRWRWTLRVYVVLAAVFTIATAIADSRAFTDKVVRVDSSGELMSMNSSLGPLAAVVAALYVGIVLAWIGGKVHEYLRSSGERRQQLKWLMTGGAISCFALIATLTFGGSFAFGGIVALPISIGIGILKFRLYEIDRLISRTISYAIVTALLVGVFLGLVALTTDVLPFSSPVGVAASTLAAAALFNPLRRRVQSAIDRRFNRARYDAAATVEAFTRRLRQAIEVDAVEGGLRDAVDRAVAPSHLTVWLRGSP